MNTSKQVAEAWGAWRGGMATFSRMLEREGVAYLSFSKVSSLEFCPQRYWLEYVERVKVRPEPKYFVKGRLLHEAAAKLHRARARGRSVALDPLCRPIEKKLDEQDARHVRNAVELMHRQVDDAWEVVAVEEGFVLDLGRELPPLLGIVDLVVRQGDEFAVIDHKGGRRFNEPDRLQLVLYAEHVRRRYGAERCAAHFDQYRWVNNLDRVRKPASCRTTVKLPKGAWNAAAKRIDQRFRQMRKIEKTGDAAGTGECMICPFRDLCPKAAISYGNGWW